MKLALESRLALDAKCLDERHQCVRISNIEALEARSTVVGAAEARPTGEDNVVARKKFSV